MKAYCDASFLTSLYAPDANSERAAREVKHASSLILSSLGELEVTNALQLRVFRKELTSREAGEALQALQDDILAGVFTVAPISPAVFERAKQLSRKHSSSLGTRSLDILHVAAAIVCGADSLYSFDVQQKLLASNVGLLVLPK
jgi:predicted nucleic acid-binding protein